MHCSSNSSFVENAPHSGGDVGHSYAKCVDNDVLWCEMTWTELYNYEAAFISTHLHFPRTAPNRTIVSSIARTTFQVQRSTFLCGDFGPEIEFCIIDCWMFQFTFGMLSQLFGVGFDTTWRNDLWVWCLCGLQAKHHIFFLCGCTRITSRCQVCMFLIEKSPASNLKRIVCGVLQCLPWLWLSRSLALYRNVDLGFVCVCLRLPCAFQQYYFNRLLGESLVVRSSERFLKHNICIWNRTNGEFDFVFAGLPLNRNVDLWVRVNLI